MDRGVHGDDGDGTRSMECKEMKEMGRAPWSARG